MQNRPHGRRWLLYLALSLSLLYAINTQLSWRPRTAAISGSIIQVSAWALRPRTVAISGSIIQVSALAFSPNGKKLAVSGLKGDLQLLDVQSGKTVWIRHRKENALESSSITQVVFSPDGKTLLSSGSSCTELRDAFSGRTLRTWPGSPFRSERGGVGRMQANGIDFWPDINTVALGYVVLRRIQATDMALVIDLYHARTGRFKGRRVLPIGMGRQVLSFTRPSPQCIFSRRGENVALKVSRVRQNGPGYSVTGEEVQIWNKEGRKQVVAANSKVLNGFLSLSNGQLLVSASSGKGGASIADTLQLWDISTGKLLYTINHFGGYHLTSSEQGTLVASNTEGAILIFDLSKRDLVRSIAAKDVDSQTLMAMSSHGDLLATTSERPSLLRLWRLK